MKKKKKTDKNFLRAKIQPPVGASQPLRLTPARFRPFGRIIRYPDKKKKSLRHNLFRIVLTEPQHNGWRIAYLIVRDKKIKRLEQHPESFESFEPLRGRSLLFVARRPAAESIRCFYLDQPVILNKGIWHGVVTLGQESEMKLTENAQVRCVYWKTEAALPMQIFAVSKKAGNRAG